MLFKRNRHISFALCTLLFALLFTGCSEDMDVTPGINEVPEGYIMLNIAVPEPTVVNSRAVDESKINVLEVFIFDKDNNSFLQHQTVNGSGISNNTVSIALNSTVLNKGNVNIYAVANVSGISELISIEELRKKLLEGELNLESTGFPMIGNAIVDTKSTVTATIPIYRSVAKLSVSSEASGYTLEEYRIYKYAEKAYLGSPINTDDSYKQFEFYTETLASDPKTVNDFTNPKYLYPSKGVSDKGTDDGAFIVVKLKNTKEGGDSYEFFRLNLRKGDEVKDGVLEHIDLKGNHYYKLKITGILRSGYSSYEEAMKHPDSDQFVAYEIHDHASEILSMITDGMRELGVTPELAFTTSSGTELKLVVKCFDKSQPEKEFIYKADGKTHEFEELYIKDQSSWLNISDPIKHLHAGSIEDPNPSWDKDDYGTQFEFNVSVAGNVYEDEEGFIIFSWCGLERQVKVTYEAAYLLPTVCDASLTIKSNSSDVFATIPDYWTFIQGKGKLREKGGNESEMREDNTPKLWGITPDVMADGKKRINGFHFPMPYGDPDQWEYEYTIDFSKFKDVALGAENTATITSIDYKIEGDAYFASNSEDETTYTVKWEPETGDLTKGKLKFVGTNKISSDYAGGRIIFTVKFSDKQTSEIIASLYHTGFFHFEDHEKYVPVIPNGIDYRGYYYYEVVPMGDGYWLDRNIGASKNIPFIDVEDPLQEVDREATGPLYTIIEETQDYQQPIWDEGMVPPGYHIPNQAEWDAVRLSTDFKTMPVSYNKIMYMSTYYETDNDKIGKVYIQKGRFYNETNVYNNEKGKFSLDPNVGDAGAGYYWSVTEAPAMEKEHTGNWVRALYLNGKASSYVNASVTDHRMLLRCKLGTNATDPIEDYISINVHEATHVYMFEIITDPVTNEETSVPLYSFPGKSIGTTPSANVWQNFYCTLSVDTKITTIYALFVKLETNGKVNIIYKDGDKFKKTTSYNANLLKRATAWELNKGHSYDFCDTALTRGYHEDEENVCAGPGIETSDMPTMLADCGNPRNPGSSGSGGGGNSGELLTGNFDWNGWYEFWWWGDKWIEENALGAKYDWSQVTPGSKLTIKVNIYAQDSMWQFFNGDWGRLVDMTADYQSSKGGDNQIFTYELSAETIKDLQDHNGLIIQGNNMGIRQVKLEIK